MFNPHQYPITMSKTELINYLFIYIVTEQLLRNVFWIFLFIRAGRKFLVSHLEHEKLHHVEHGGNQFITYNVPKICQRVDGIQTDQFSGGNGPPQVGQDQVVGPDAGWGCCSAGDSSTVAQGLRTLSIHGLGAGNFLGPAVMSGELAGHADRPGQTEAYRQDARYAGGVLSEAICRQSQTQSGQPYHWGGTVEVGRSIPVLPGWSGRVGEVPGSLAWCRRTASGSCMDRCISTFQPADLMGIKGVTRTAVGGFIPFIERSAPSIAAPQYSICINRWRLAIVAITSQSEVDVPNIYIYIYIYLFIFIFKCMYIHVFCFLFIHMRRTTTWNIPSVELAPML